MIETVGSPVLWLGFMALVTALLALDLGVFKRGDDAVTSRQALRWTVAWVTVGLAFAAGMFAVFGSKIGWEFLTGYVIEYSLSVDNLFVFILVFRVFRIPAPLQQRVLFWGIIGALAMRLIMIMAGAVLVARFHWVLYVFGAFLLFSGLKILLGAGGDDDEEEHPEQNPVVRAIMRVVPSSNALDGRNFFTRVDGRRLATPLFLCLVTVEISDVIFAVDSIPAIFAITQDPFVVFTSNIFAILGLRSLYFLLADWVGLFRYLETGLGIVLSFVGGKMLATYFDIHVHAGLSLGLIVGVLAGSVLLSVFIKERPSADPAAADPPTPGPAAGPPPG